MSSDRFADVFGPSRGDGQPALRSRCPRGGQAYFVAIRADGTERTFYSALHADETLAQASRWAGADGQVQECFRERLNDFVGSPVWGRHRHIHAHPGTGQLPVART